MTRTRKMLGGALAVVLAVPVFSAAQDEERHVAVHVGRLLTGTGEELENVTILMTDGKIEAVGEKVELPFPCEEVDARGLTAMPGLIHPGSRLGLVNYTRSGVRANLRVMDEFLPADDAYDDALEAGFTTLVLEPPGSGLPGRALVIRSADVGAGLVLEEESYVKLNLTSPGNDKKTLEKAFDDAQKEIEKVQKAREEWEKKQKAAEEAAKKKAEEEAKKKEQEEKEKKENGGKSYRDEPPQPKPEDKKPEEKKKEEFQPPEIKPELQPLVDILEGKDGAFAVAEIGNASTYLHLKDALRKHEVSLALLSNTRQAGAFGRQDLFFVADEMGKNKEKVVVYPGLVNYPYSINQVNLPKKLADAGVEIAFGPFSDSTNLLQSMRYQVGEVIRGGLPRDVAVKALTLNVAQAVGLGERLGSIEKGKDGNLLLLSGDPFDVQTRVEKVLIEGTVAYDRDEDED